MQGIVICTHIENRPFLTDLIDSIKTEYPITIVINEASTYTGSLPNLNLLVNEDDGWEAGAIKTALNETDYDEFLFLQDSIVIKSNYLFPIIFKAFEGQSVGLANRLQMYLGKFRREVLEQMEIPKVRNKQEAVLYEERFGKEYCKLEEPVWFFPVRDTNKFEDKHGRNNMILENDYFKKYKGTWGTVKI